MRALVPWHARVVIDQHGNILEPYDTTQIIIQIVSITMSILICSLTILIPGELGHVS